MKTPLLSSLALLACIACNQAPKDAPVTTAEPAILAGQSGVKDDESQKNIVQTAIASPDHETLVSALKAAGYVDALTNAGPFTVFAPVDAAFDALPEGTLDDLMKPENKVALQDVLEYHVYVGVIRESMMRDGMKLDQVNGKKVTLTKEGDNIRVNGASILATVQTSNGVIYVIDKVLVP